MQFEDLSTEQQKSIIENRKRHSEFLKWYRQQHELCPKCGHDSYETTLMGYVLMWETRYDYKNMNRCKCVRCGDVHTTHDREPTVTQG